MRTAAGEVKTMADREAPARPAGGERAGAARPAGGNRTGVARPQDTGAASFTEEVAAEIGVDLEAARARFGSGLRQVEAATHSRPQRRRPVAGGAWRGRRQAAAEAGQRLADTPAGHHGRWGGAGALALAPAGPKGV